MKEIVLITGGSQGLGREIASKLKSKYEVVVLDIDTESLKNINTELGIKTYECDVTDVGKVIETIDHIEKEIGDIDILINNAGVYITGELDKNDYSDIAKVILVNTVGSMYVTKAVVPTMKKNKNGKIIFINSIRGIEGKEERSVYCASKWAITGFAKSLRMELEKDGVEVISLYPGLMKTNLFKNANVDRDMRGAMEPEEVAQVVAEAIDSRDLVIEDICFKKRSY